MGQLLSDPREHMNQEKGSDPDQPDPIAGKPSPRRRAKTRSRGSTCQRPGTLTPIRVAATRSRHGHEDVAHYILTAAQSQINSQRAAQNVGGSAVATPQRPQISDGLAEGSEGLVIEQHAASASATADQQRHTRD